MTPGRKGASLPARATLGGRVDLQDILFAAATLSAINGVNVIGKSIPLFVVFVVALVICNIRTLRAPATLIFTVPPLVIFLIVHLLSSLRLGAGNAAFLVAQAGVLAAFTGLFITRYAARPMGGYFAITGVFMLMLMAYVIGWHVMNGYYFSWKRLSDAKAVFNVLPLLLVIAARSPNPLTRRIYPLLVVALVTAIMISGERKAYILLVLVSPLLVNFGNPLTYVLPFLLIVSLPVAVSLERTGYIARQINTLEGFSEGRVVNTISNEGREAAVQAAVRIFKEHPVLGVGTNREPVIAQQFDPTISVPHNEWLRVSAENGVIGLFFYAVTVLWGIAGLLKVHVLGRTRSVAERQIAFALTAMLVLYISFEAFDFIVLQAFMLIPFVPYLRLDPRDGMPVRSVGSTMHDRLLARAESLKLAKRAIGHGEGADRIDSGRDLV